MSAVQVLEGTVRPPLVVCAIKGCDLDARGNVEQAAGTLEAGLEVDVELLLCPSHAAAFTLVRDGVL